MKKSLFLLLMAFAAICLAAASCNNNLEGNEVNDEILGKTPRLMEKSLTSLMAKEDMPEWLATKVTELEKDAYPLAYYKVYQCSWKSQTVYNIHYNFSSCTLCDTYYADGSQIEWEKTTDVVDFCDNSSDWKCIYVIDNTPRS
ncbi:MAG: hypothetical protein J5814_03275 [Bacteroidaceae bacterium]|nr:hypothetical protein [Bacteroidaceae bacterium]